MDDQYVQKKSMVSTTSGARSSPFEKSRMDDSDNWTIYALDKNRHLQKEEQEKPENDYENEVYTFDDSDEG